MGKDLDPHGLDRAQRAGELEAAWALAAAAGKKADLAEAARADLAEAIERIGAELGILRPLSDVQIIRAIQALKHRIAELEPVSEPGFRGPDERPGGVLPVPDYLSGYKASPKLSELGILKDGKAPELPVVKLGGGDCSGIDYPPYPRRLGVPAWALLQKRAGIWSEGAALSETKFVKYLYTAEERAAALAEYGTIGYEIREYANG